MISKFGISMVLLAASGISAADSKPQPGSYGFNWLDADSHCKKITDKDLAQMSECTVSADAFGLEVPSHMCRINPQVELVIYKTKAECQEGLETMQANGP